MRLNNPIQTARSHLSFYGWRMVLVGCLFRFLGGGFHFYGFTVFVSPLGKDLGISRAATNLVFGLARAEGALEGPLAGYLIDRFGPRPIMMIAVLLTGLGYVLCSWIESYWALLVVYLGVVSLAFGAGFMHCPMVLANSWFSRYRARAMALVSCSIGIGGALLAPVLAYVVHYFGWRWGMVFAGVSFLALGTPLAAVVRRSPEDMGLALDGGYPPRSPQAPAPAAGGGDAGAGGETTAGEAGAIAAGNAATGGEATAEADIGIWEAIRGAPFWLLVASTLFRVLGLSTVIANFVQILGWKGVGPLAASWFLGVFAALSLPTHLVVGWMADRLNKARLMAVCMVIAAAGLVLLTYAQNTLWIWLFLPLFSLVEAVFPVTWAMVGELYGRRHFAKVRGNMGFFYQWGGMIGPALAGAIYDATQSYKPALLGMAALYVIAAVLYLLLGRTRLARMRAARVG